MAKVRTVMVFGVFDRLHEGHRSFLRQAATHGKVIAVVARDSVVRRLKKQKTLQAERTRVARVRSVSGVVKSVLGDKKEEAYAVIKKFKPHIICFGYDQDRLGQNIRLHMKSGTIPRVRLIRLRPYRQTRYHSSQLGQCDEC